MTKIKFLLLIIIIVSMNFLQSCKKEEGGVMICDVGNPVKDLPWLKAKIDEIMQQDNSNYKYSSYFMTAIYNDERVFFYGNCDPFVSYISFVYNCNGDELGSTSQLINELSNINLLWKHPASECNFNYLNN